MAIRRITSTVLQIRTLFGLGRLGDLADGELLESFGIHHEEAEAAFEELLLRHGPMVLDVCRRVLRDPNDVEDAFQATFLILVRRAGTIRNRDALGGWLHRVALRVALRARSDAANRHEIEHRAASPEAADPTEDSIERADMRSALHQELDRMPASYRVALVACYVEGLTHEEAASRLQLPVGTVRSRLARGRDRLRDRLARRGFAPSVLLPTAASRPESVPAGLQALAIQSMCSYVTGHSLTGRVSSLAERVIRAMKLRMLTIVGAVALMVGAIGGTIPFLPVPVPRQAVAAQQAAPPVLLAGVVRDSDGHPVTSATVVAGAFSVEPNHRIATTGADGRFSFQSAQARDLHYVLAYKDGLAPASKFHGLGRNPVPAGELVLVLARPAPFVGTVRDPGGAPIGGATVRIRHMRSNGGKYDHNPIVENVLRGTPLESLFQTTTDDQGRFRFPAVPDPHRVAIGVTAAGKGDLSSEVPGDYEAGFISGTEAEPARLTMEPEARIVGRIVTKLPGVSVDGLKVGLQSTDGSVHFWRDAKTDAEGRFEMHGLPEGGGNIFPMDHHPTGGPWTYRAIDNLALHPGKTAEVTIELITGVLVKGRVVDAATGDPVVGLSIGMYGPARPRSGAAIMSMKTDDNGQYRFRLPAGKTYLYTAEHGSWSDAAQTVEVPADVNVFEVPDLRVTKVKPAEPAEKPAPAPEPERAGNASTTGNPAGMETLEFAGVVRDVSDAPIGDATVVASLLDRDVRIARQVVTTNPDGRFTLRLGGPKEPKPLIKIYAFKEGLAPVGANATKSDKALTLVLTRTRPFLCVVQDRHETPIGGAEAWVQSINAPVPEGQGMMVTEFSRPALEGTPIETALRATSDSKGLIRLPSMPARSQVNLTVTAKGKRTHRTTDFTRPGMTGTWPAGFDGAFLSGNADAPAIIYLDPEKERKISS